MPRSPTLGALAALAVSFTSGLSLIPQRVLAQYQPQTVSLAIGPTIPRAPYADSVRSGYHATAGLGFHFGERFTVRAEGMYQQLARKSTAEPRNNQMIGFSSGAELGLLGSGGPYVLGGYGFYQTMKSGSTPASKWERGYNFGGGWRLFTPRFSLFAEARLHRLRGPTGVAMVPFSFGIRI